MKKTMSEGVFGETKQYLKKQKVSKVAVLLTFLLLAHKGVCLHVAGLRAQGSVTFAMTGKWAEGRRRLYVPSDSEVKYAYCSCP